MRRLLYAIKMRAPAYRSNRFAVFGFQEFNIERAANGIFLAPLQIRRKDLYLYFIS